MPERLVIVGAGAIGGSVGVMLHEAGCPVILVARGEHGRVIREQGLRLKTPTSNVLSHPACVGDVAEVDWRDSDAVMFAVKTQQAELAMDAVLASAGSDVPVVCASNGVQCEQWAAERFSQVISMLVWVPATHLEPGQVCIHAQPSPGAFDAGKYKGDKSSVIAAWVCEQFLKAGFESEQRDDIMRWKYAKLISNLGNSAQALVTDDWKAVAAVAKKEGEAVFDAAGIDRVDSKALYERAGNVRMAKVAGEDRRGGSTWQSRVLGKPLETPWLEGAVVAIAEKHNVPVPVNQYLTKAAEQNRSLTAAEVFSACGLSYSPS